MQEDKPEPPPSLDLALSEIERAVDRQFDQIDSLDTKAGFVLGAASFLITGVAVLQAWVYSRPPGSHAARLAQGEFQWLTRAVAVLYVLVILFSFLAYRLGDSMAAPKPAWWKPNVLESELAGTLDFDPRTVVMNRLLAAFEYNAGRITSKVRWTGCALWLFLIESVCLAVILVLVSLG